MTVLYNNTTGTNGTVTLSQTAANFTHLRIYYHTTNDDVYNSVEIYAPNGKNVTLISAYADTKSVNMYTKYKMVKISGTTITTIKTYELNEKTSTITSTNYINIVRVEGFKY